MRLMPITTVHHRRIPALVGLLGTLLVLSACSVLPGKTHAPDESPVITGSAPRSNKTPLDPAFVCLAAALKNQSVAAPSIAVGDVKDYTGQYSQAEGNAITQGGSLMIYSALGKLGDRVRVHERFDTRIAELELAYADRRQLGDGQVHNIESGKPPVPWVPYFGGTILRSDYYIVGGITEVNYNISSGGAELNVNNVGGKRRTYTMSVGVDLRIVDSRSLVVAKTISLQKQIVGEEVGAGIFRFFGTELVDLSVGAKRQEPLQLAIRTAIEHGVLELVGGITGQDAQNCIVEATTPPEKLAAERKAEEKKAQDLKAMEAKKAAEAKKAEDKKADVKKAEDKKPVEKMVDEKKPEVKGPAEKKADDKVALVAVPVPVAVAKPSPAAVLPAKDDTQKGTPVNAVSSSGAGTGSSLGVGFEINSPAMVGAGNGALTAVLKAATEGNQDVPVELLAREGENLPPAQRQQLTQARIKTFSDALAARGIAPARIAVNWIPEPNAPMERQGAGMQLLARLTIKAAKGW